ncbi:hypothetical protein CPB85DRAFT_1435573 [Mucidula mucida]|nr:hypothetical protein CPB85DRAFT_1435573 [Mucidula mucida]
MSPNILEYDSCPSLARTSPFLIFGENRRARADIYIFGGLTKEILLIVREDQCIGNQDPVDAQAQLVAAAVAAFRENNLTRVAAGREPFSEKVIPGIVISGTSPTFLKVPITETLSRHIRDGTYPPDITSVMFCKPPVPRPALWKSEGMMPLDSRCPILSCYEAFKSVVGI